MKNLFDVMPDEFSTDFKNSEAFKLGEFKVVSIHHCETQADKWPGKQKNVYFWVELDNGKAVGWNENPSKGWSFPVIKLKK